MIGRTMLDHTTARRQRRSGLLLTTGLLCGAVLAAALGSRNPAPVGYWRSATGRSRYFEAYDAAFADFPDPAETLDVRTDHGVVRVYRFTGRGESRHPLLLLPGTASGSPVWTDNVPLLLEIGDVYALDLLGEPGRSIQDRPITEAAHKASWLDEVLAALPEERFHLIGMSLGGWTAINLALHEDARVASVVALDAVLSFADIPWTTVLRSVPAVLPWLPRSWRDSFTSYTAGGAPVEDLPVARMIEAGMQHYRMASAPLTRITPEHLGDLEAPFLAIIAGRSVMHDAQQAADTARTALPDARVEVFPDASHAISGEYPDQIAALVADFVADVERR